MDVPYIEKTTIDDRDVTVDWKLFDEWKGTGTSDVPIGGLTISSCAVTCSDVTLIIAAAGAATVSGSKTQIEMSVGTLNVIYETVWTVTWSNGRKIGRVVRYAVVIK